MILAKHQDSVTMLRESLSLCNNHGKGKDLGWMGTLEANSKFLAGSVVDQRCWNDRLFSIYVEASVGPFEAGQFGRIGLDIDGEQVMRPYSFVNRPDEGVLEFHYNLVEDGLLTKKLVNLNSGDSIFISPKPNGFLVLSEVPKSTTLWMLSTGTGIGPFVSIVRVGDVFRHFKNAVLVHGVRYQQDLSYADELRQLEKENMAFKYVPFVSREDVDFAVKARIPEKIADGFLQEYANLEISLDTSQFMLCGNPQMLKDATVVLKSLGFERNRRKTPGHITMESYW